MTESNFEHEFCEWFIHDFPEAAFQEGNGCEEKVNNYLKGNQEKLDCMLPKVYNYIKREKVTHYISAIKLGACIYSLSFLTKCCHIRKAKAEAGVEFLGGMGMGAEASRKKSHDVSKKYCIGELSNVKSGNGEAVIGYDILPIFTLVCPEHKEIKNILRQAIYYYLQRSSKLATSRGLLAIGGMTAPTVTENYSHACH